MNLNKTKNLDLINLKNQFYLVEDKVMALSTLVVLSISLTVSLAEETTTPLNIKIEEKNFTVNGTNEFYYLTVSHTSIFNIIVNLLFVDCECQIPEYNHKTVLWR